jgi:hypothetical protein
MDLLRPQRGVQEQALADVSEIAVRMSVGSDALVDLI